MRTSPDGRALPELDWEMWAERPSGAYECVHCGAIYWVITTPSPNTHGGTDQMRAHQRRHMEVD